MQKIHEPKKLFTGNVKITEICYRHFSKNKNKKQNPKKQTEDIGYSDIPKRLSSNTFTIANQFEISNVLD